MLTDTTTKTLPSATKPRSAAAERMRAHRERRRNGLRSVIIQLRETEIDILIRKGLLKADARNDTCALGEAMHTYLDRTLSAGL